MFIIPKLSSFENRLYSYWDKTDAEMEISFNLKSLLFKGGSDIGNNCFVMLHWYGVVLFVYGLGPREVPLAQTPPMSFLEGILPRFVLLI